MPGWKEIRTSRFLFWNVNINITKRIITLAFLFFFLYISFFFIQFSECDTLLDVVEMKNLDFHILNFIPRYCWSLASPGPLQFPDGCASSTEDGTCFNQPTKDVRIGGPNTPSDGFVSIFSNILSILFWVRAFTFFHCVRAFYSVRSFVPFNGGKTFWLVMMVLRWWQSHHCPTGGC